LEVGLRQFWVVFRRQSIEIGRTSPGLFDAVFALQKEMDCVVGSAGKKTVEQVKEIGGFVCIDRLHGASGLESIRETKPG
jgi:hypothetical protein